MSRTNTSVVEEWLDLAWSALRADPTDNLGRLLYPGHNRHQPESWGPGINKVCKHPRNRTHRYLRNEVREVLLISLENRLRQLETSTYRGLWAVGEALNLGDALRIIELLDDRAPLAACFAKIRLNRICRAMGTTLQALEQPAFVTYIGDTKHLKW